MTLLDASSAGCFPFDRFGPDSSPRFRLPSVPPSTLSGSPGGSSVSLGSQPDSLASGDERDGEESEEVCPICQEVQGEAVLLDSCGHSYCFRCINEWSKVKNSCPLCNRRFSKILASASGPTLRTVVTANPSEGGDTDDESDYDSSGYESEDGVNVILRRPQWRGHDAAAVAPKQDEKKKEEEEEEEEGACAYLDFGLDSVSEWIVCDSRQDPVRTRVPKEFPRPQQDLMSGASIGESWSDAARHPENLSVPVSQQTPNGKSAFVQDRLPRTHAPDRIFPVGYFPAIPNPPMMIEPCYVPSINQIPVPGYIVYHNQQLQQHINWNPFQVDGTSVIEQRPRPNVLPRGGGRGRGSTVFYQSGYRPTQMH